MRLKKNDTSKVKRVLFDQKKKKEEENCQERPSEVRTRRMESAMLRIFQTHVTAYWKP